MRTINFNPLKFRSITKMASDLGLSSTSSARANVAANEKIVVKAVLKEVDGHTDMPALDYGTGEYIYADGTISKVPRLLDAAIRRKVLKVERVAVETTSTIWKNALI